MVLRVHSKSYPMNTNMTGFRWFSEIFHILAMWIKKMDLAYEGLKDNQSLILIVRQSVQFDQYKMMQKTL